MSDRLVIFGNSYDHEREAHPPFPVPHAAPAHAAPVQPFLRWRVGHPEQLIYSDTLAASPERARREEEDHDARRRRRRARRRRQRARLTRRRARRRSGAQGD